MEFFKALNSLQHVYVVEGGYGMWQPANKISVNKIEVIFFRNDGKSIGCRIDDVLETKQFFEHGPKQITGVLVNPSVLQEVMQFSTNCEWDLLDPQTKDFFSDYIGRKHTKLLFVFLSPCNLWNYLAAK